MKKITKLTVGALAFAMFGLTSCVQDDVTPEVKEIYKNQLALLQSKTKYEAARTAMKEAEARVAEAASLRDVALAGQQLTENEIKHAATVIALQSALDAANASEAATYAGKYLYHTNLANDARKDLAAEEVALKNLLASNTVIVDKKQAVAGQERAIVGIEKSIESKEKEIAMYQSFLSDTSTYEKQILDLQKKKDLLDEAIEDKGASVTWLEGKRDNAQLLSEKIEISESMYGFLNGLPGVSVTSSMAGTGVMQYFTTYSEVLDAKNVIDQRISSYNDNVSNKETDIANTQSAINSAFLPSGVAAAYTNRAAARAALSTIKDAKQAELNVANDSLTLIQEVIEEYSKAIANYATATGYLTAGSSTVANVKSQLSDLEADYNEVRAAYLANPNVNYVGLHHNHKDFAAPATSTVLDPAVLGALGTALESDGSYYDPFYNAFEYINFDNQAGNLSDANSRSWMQVSSVSGGIVSVNPASIQTSAVPSMSPGENNYYNYTWNHRNGTPIAGISVGDWIDVEEDDDAASIQTVYDELQRRYNLMRTLVETLEGDNAPIAAFAQKQLDLINTYNSVTLEGMLAAAQAKVAAATAALSTATSNYNKFVGMPSTVDSYYNALNTDTEDLAALKQNHKELLANKTEFDALLTLANDMVSDSKLAELKALEDKIAAVKASILQDQREANALQRQIAFIKAFGEPNSVVGASYGDTFTGNELAIKAEIKLAQTALIGYQNDLEDAKAVLAYLQSKDATAEEVKAYLVKRIEDRIAKLKVKVAANEALAAKYFALWEKYINA